MTNKSNRVLYTGVTSNLFRRITEHKEKIIEGFTNRYNVTKLVYYEEFSTMEEAIAREKQIKGGSRQKNLTSSTVRIQCGMIFMKNFLLK